MMTNTRAPRTGRRKNRLLLATTLLVAAAATASIALTPSIAFAEPTPAEASVARDHFKEGMDASKAGRWEEARSAFQRSYDVWPRPLTLLNLAGAQVECGKLVAASESYRRFLREATSATADPKAAEHKTDAQQALAQVEARLPRVRVRVENLRENDVVDMDGQTLSTAMLGVYFPADPQEHRVSVTRGGAQVATSSFRLQEKETTKEILLVAPASSSSPNNSNITGTAAVGAGLRENAAERGAGWFKPSPADTPRGDGGEAKKSGGSVFSSPWFWAITGTLVTAGVVTGVVLATRSSNNSELPPAFMGNVPPSRIVVR